MIEFTGFYMRCDVKSPAYFVENSSFGVIFKETCAQHSLKPRGCDFVKELFRHEAQ